MYLQRNKKISLLFHWKSALSGAVYTCNRYCSQNICCERGLRKCQSIGPETEFFTVSKEHAKVCPKCFTIIENSTWKIYVYWNKFSWALSTDVTVCLAPLGSLPSRGEDHPGYLASPIMDEDTMAWAAYPHSRKPHILGSKVWSGSTQAS